MNLAFKDDAEYKEFIELATAHDMSMGTFIRKVLRDYKTYYYKKNPIVKEKQTNEQTSKY